MNFKQFKSSISEKRTKGWIKTLTAIGLILLFFIYWLLFCDPDLLQLDWFCEPKSDSDNDLIKSGFISLNVIWILLGLIGFTILYFIVAKYLFRFANYDLLPFIVFPIVFGIMLVITGFIPYNSNNRGWIIFARFIIVIITAILFFTIAIYFSNRILLKSNDSSFIYEDIKKDYEEMEKIKAENEAIIGSEKKRRKRKDYIEI